MSARVTDNDRATNRRGARRRYLPLVLVLSGGVALSVAAFFAVREREFERSLAALERRGHGYSNALQRSIESHVEVLHSIAGLYAASRRVERHEFGELAGRALSRHGGVRALAWVPRVRDSQRAAYESMVRTEGYPRFQITEQGSRGRMVKALRRAEYFPVHYVEPVTGNEVALGFDVASDAARREALEAARDAGEPAASAPVILLQDSGDRQGVLVFVPIYRRGVAVETVEARRRNLVGFALGVFRVGDLVEASLRGHAAPGLGLYLYDDAPPDRRLLYAHMSRHDPAAADRALMSREPVQEGLHWNTVLEVGRRRWQLQFRPAADSLDMEGVWRARVVLVGGLLSTALVAAYLHAISNRAAQIAEVVQRRTLALSKANEDLEKEIAERRRSEEALRQSEERYRDLVENSEDLICTHDLDGTIVSANRALMRRFGYEREEEIVGRTVQELLAPAVRHLFDAYRDEIAAHGRAQGLMKVITRDGEERILEYHNSLRTEGLDRPIVRGRSHDVTERVRAQKALAKRVQQMQVLRDITTEITRELDLKSLLGLIAKGAAELTESASGVVSLRDEAAQLLASGGSHGVEAGTAGPPFEALDEIAQRVARHREGLIVNDDRTSAHANRLARNRADLSSYMGEPLVYRDRPIGVVAVYRTGRVFHDEERELLSLFAHQAVIAIENARLYSALEGYRMKLEELHRVGSAIQEPMTLQERLDAILKGAQAVLGFERINILLPDFEKSLLRAVASVGVEEPLEQVCVPLGPAGGGVAMAFLEGREVVWDGAGTVPEAYRLAPPYAEIAAFRSRAFANVPLIVRGTAIGVLGADNKFSRRPITPEMVRLLRIFTAQAALAIDNARLYEEVAGYAKELERKVEERTVALKQAQVQLIQSAKLAAVGTLAAGIAHELNQPLMVIRGYAQELLGDARIDDEEIRGDLRRIEAQTTRMAAIINHLRDFSRQSKGRRQVTDLNRVVAQALTFLGQQLRIRNLEVIEELDPNLPSVWVDSLQIEQVVMNLVTNARDAMETTDRGTILIRTEGNRNGQIALSVTDTGPGIPPDLQARIFDPFFTTKEVGKGTGLGLSICHGIIEDHGGEICVESPVAEGRGARLTVVLPGYRGHGTSGEGERA